MSEERVGVVDQEQGRNWYKLISVGLVSIALGFYTTLVIVYVISRILYPILGLLLFGLINFYVQVVGIGVGLVSVPIYFWIIKRRLDKKTKLEPFLLAFFILSLIHGYLVLGLGSQMYRAHIELADETYNLQTKAITVGMPLGFYIEPDELGATYRRSMYLPLALLQPDGTLIESRVEILALSDNCSSILFVTTCRARSQRDAFLKNYFIDPSKSWQDKYVFDQIGVYELKSSSPLLKGITFQVVDDPSNPLVEQNRKRSLKEEILPKKVGKYVRSGDGYVGPGTDENQLRFSSYYTNPDSRNQEIIDINLNESLEDAKINLQETLVYYDGTGLKPVEKFGNRIYMIPNKRVPGIFDIVWLSDTKVIQMTPRSEFLDEFVQGFLAVHPSTL